MKRDKPIEALLLWRLAAKAKTEPRQGWTYVPRVGRIESVADHSFGVAILSLFEADRRGYDVERALKLALIHDFEEAITGDLTPHDKRKLTPKVVARLREAARSRILKLIPPERRKGYQGLWDDLETGRSKEARLVKDLDKLEMACQARIYESSGVEHKRLARFFDSAISQIKDGALKKAAREVEGGD